MTEEVIGRGIIEVITDGRKLRAGMEEAKKSVHTFAESQKASSKEQLQSIDRYIGKLQTQAATIGKSTRETELYKIAVRGASNEQIKAADAALRAIEKQTAAIAASARAQTAAADRSAAVLARLRSGFVSLAAATGVSASLAGITRLVTGFISASAELDDLSEKTGASVEALSRLSQQAFISGTEIGTVETALVRLAKGLSGTDEESAGARRALAALGLEASKLRNLDTADALTEIALKLNEFRDSAGKTAIAVALFGRSGAQVLPFLKDLANDQALVARVTTEQAAKAEELEKATRRLGNAFKVSGQELAIGITPALSTMIERMNTAVRSAGSLQNAVARFAVSFFTRGGVGAFAELFSQDDPGKRIKDLNAEVERLQNTLDNPARGVGASMLARARAQLEGIRKELELTKEVQRQIALDAGRRLGGDTPGERARFALKTVDFSDELRLIQQVAAERQSAIEKGITAELAATEARHAATTHLVASQRELERAELESIAKRVTAARAAFEAETTLARSRDSTIQKSNEDQRAAGNRLYDNLITRSNEYLNVFKKNQLAIVALDQELADSRKRTADFIKGIEREGFTDAQKRQALIQDGFETQSKLRDAVLAGNEKERNKQAEDLLRIAELLKSSGDSESARRFAEEAQRLRELGIEAQKFVTTISGKEAELGLKTVQQQIAEINKELARLQGTALAGVKVDVKQEDLAALVDKIRTAIENQFFTVKLKPEAQINGTAVPIPGLARGGIGRGLALVGEEGPELVQFLRPARVYSAPQTREIFTHAGGQRVRAMAGGGVITPDTADRGPDMVIELRSGGRTVRVKTPREQLHDFVALFNEV